MVRVVLLLLAGATALAAQACEDFDRLRDSGTLHVAVHFATTNARLIRATERGLDYWATVAVMDWRPDDTSHCQLTVTDQFLTPSRPGYLVIARSDIPQADTFRGLFRWNNDEAALSHSDDELAQVAVHEIGHLLGLGHNRRPGSLMYWLSARNQELLPSDLKKLSKWHRLR